MNLPQTSQSNLIGVVAALPAEARCLTVRPPAYGEIAVGGNLLIAVCGIGAQAARRGAEALIERRAGMLVSWGTAGALSPSLRSGELLLPEVIRGADGRSLPVDGPSRERLMKRLAGMAAIRGGELLQCEAVIRTPADKTHLFTTTGAAAVDMESAAIAAVAATAGVPFLAVRAILDTHLMTIPACALAATDAQGRTHLPTLLAGLWRRPGEIVELLGLACAFRRALASLTRAAEFL